MRRLLLGVLGATLLLGAPSEGPHGGARAFAAGQRTFNCRRPERQLVALERRERRRAARGRSLGRGAVRRLERLRGRLADHCVSLNEIQVLGSHNSYHVEPRAALLTELLRLFGDLFLAWEYTHLPLDQQLEQQGIRQIELDVFADPEGGLYAERRGLLAIGQDPRSGLPALDQPGLKVLHIQDLDFETTCLTFVECLQTLRAWSDAHPAHLPLMVLVEAKDEPIPDPFALGFAAPVPFGPTELDAIDAEIRTVFPPERLLTPDDVRGDLASLEEAILMHGWPTLAAARGRVLFALDNGGAVRRAYVDGHPGLAGRILFTDSPPGDPEAAFVKLNDPLGAVDLISDLVATGYIVRTRADADTLEARRGDTTRREAALASGAQFVSTDYPVENPAFGTGYVVRIPDGSPARCNPVNAPRGCRSPALEHL
jgi:hypothetical protein